jgi:hypothetical protein
MAESWFYVVGDQQVGPVSLEELRAAVAVGIVKPSSKVRPGSSKAWYLAERVPGLISTGVVMPTPVGGVPVPPGVSMVGVPRVPVPPPPPGLSPPGIPGVPIPPSPPESASLDFSPPELAYNPQVVRSLARKKRRSLAGPIFTVLGLLALGGAGAGIWYVMNLPQPEAPPPTVADASTPATNEPKQVEKVDKQVEQKTKQIPAEQRSFAEAKHANAKHEDKEPSRVAPTAAGLYQGEGDLSPANKIDELVFAKLKSLGIPPAQLSSDGVFLRRVYLDVIGTLPKPTETREFLGDKAADKRKVLIDKLLSRREYADYWAMRWSDTLRIKAEFPINLWPNAAQAYHRWLRGALKQNMSYDQFVREMLTSCGSNFRVGQVNFYRALQSKKPEPIAKAVALTFMGERTDNWAKERVAGMSAFFSMIGYKGTAEWKEEIVMFDPSKAKQFMPPEAKPANAKNGDAAPQVLRGLYPDGTDKKWVELSAQRDPREIFADWLIDGKNPKFTRPIVNRLWCALFGRGIVEEPDDFRADNPPQNPELLDYLAQELVSSKFDQKHVLRLILNSKTYQLSCIPKGKIEESAANFGHYALRQLEAEVLIDAVCQITGTTESYTSAIPEPYTWVPEFSRTIMLPDGSITSSFLEMFGRPSRDSGMESERNKRPTASQRLHMLNSTHIRQKIWKSEVLQKLTNSVGDDKRKVVDELYLLILSRFPSDQERRDAGYNPASQIAWALMNTAEFFCRH